MSAETNTPSTTVVVSPAHGADEIAHQLDQRDNRPSGSGMHPWIERGAGRWTNTVARLEEKTGLRLGVAYDTLVQGASAANGDAWTAAGDLTLLAHWSLWGRDSGYEGALGFSGRNRRAFTDTAPSALGGSIGSLWATTDGFTDKGWQLPEAWFEQKAWDGRITFRTGQLNIRTLFDTASLRSARLYFLNTAFSLNPAVPFPLFGAGSALFVKPVDNVELRLGAADARARKIDGPFDTVLRSDDVFVVGGISWTPRLMDAGRTRFQLTGWHIDPTQANTANDGSGFSVLVEQQFAGSGTTIFGRGAWSDSRATVVAAMVSAGAGWKPLEARPADLCGFAAGYGRPHDSALGNEAVMECFYRVQVSSGLQITPDLQLVVHPSAKAASDVVAVFGLRARLAF